MKFFSKFLASTAATAFAAITFATIGFSGVANADCYQYNANGFVTSATPVYNNICGAPNGIGNEADFVRVRQSTNGNDEDNTNNPVYQNSVTSACTAGTKFDVWNYMHNDATSDDNNNGTGSAVAHDVQLALSAPLGSTNSNFTVGATITASNAASVSDTATIDCGSTQAKLTLVPSTVHIYSLQYGWNNLPDNAVNGTTKIGSPTLGSGDQWGCWDYRVVVVYEVTVTPVVTPPPSSLACTLSNFTVEQNERKVSLAINAAVSNATVTGYLINWGDGTSSNKQTDTHTYASTITGATITASFTAKLPNKATQTVSGTNCVRTVSFTPNTTPPPPPTTLVNTGAGNVLGLFGLSAVLGTLGYRFFLSRRLRNDS